ncbi:hypothetical protein [Cellulomonas bogoriensis]
MTDPSFTFVMQLVAGPIVAVQIDRLTQRHGEGSVLWLLVGSAVLALSVWFARTREVIETVERDHNEGAWFEDRLGTVIDELKASIETTDEAARGEARAVLAELRAIRARLD